jgi:hypothetical protein
MKNSIEYYIAHLEESFKKAEQGISKINGEILDMYGMTGHKTRHFYNNLLDIEDSRYLEIGTWGGSSVCAAMYKNKSTVVCIDNWSEFGGSDVKDVFFEYFAKFKGKNKTAFIEQDCFKVNVSALKKFNIYLYDGGHSYDDHYKALSYYIDCLDDEFIYIVDDWNWEKVRRGAKNSIIDLGLEILWQKEIILTENDAHTPMNEAKLNWWNGIAVFLLQKNQNVS